MLRPSYPTRTGVFQTAKVSQILFFIWHLLWLEYQDLSSQKLNNFDEYYVRPVTFYFTWEKTVTPFQNISYLTHPSIHPYLKIHSQPWCFPAVVLCFERYIYSCFLICICRLIYSFCCIASKCLFKWGKYKKRCLTQNLCMIQHDVTESWISRFLLFDFCQLSPLFKYFVRFLSLYIYTFSCVSKYLCVSRCMRFCWW